MDNSPTYIVYSDDHGSVCQVRVQRTGSTAGFKEEEEEEEEKEEDALTSQM